MTDSSSLDRIPTCFVTGASGLLGSAFIERARIKGWRVLAHSRSNETVSGDYIVWDHSDLRDSSTVKVLIDRYRPFAVFHLAALTNVDWCERNPEETYAFNEGVSRLLSAESREAGIPIIYVSTDSVFAGDRGDYSETDVPEPTNVYSASKLAGEYAVAEENPDHLVVRANIFGWNRLAKKSLAEWVLGQLENDETVPGFTDCMFAPLYVGTLSELLIRLHESDFRGTIHAASRPALSKYDFARKIAKQFGCVDSRIQETSMDDVDFAAVRPRNSSLDPSKMEEVLGIAATSIDDEIGCFEREREVYSGNSKSYVPSLAYGRQWIDDDDVAAVAQALKSDYLTTGTEVTSFEQEFAEKVGAKHAVAVSNATTALHLAMLVAGIGKGDRVVTSPNTFLSSANCAAFVGAIPDFADIDPETFNLCVKSLEANWKDDTRAVVAVAYGGLPTDMPAIAELARQRNAIVIEDGCHGPGGGFVHEGKFYKIGGHPWADITTFSFHPVKTMTTGEGGMLVTNNDVYAQQARLLRSHGMVRESAAFTVFGDTQSGLTASGPWVYEMQALGYNYRITDIQCALGRSQLKKLESFVQRRQRIVDLYNEAFSDLAWLQTPKDGGWLPEKGDSNGCSQPVVSWHLYTVQLDFEALNKTRIDVIERLRDQGVGTQVLYIPVYLQPWYQETFGYEPGKCPNAEAFYQRALSLPLYPAMSDEDVQYVIKCVSALSGK
ncbi:MAG: UDP-4-amino-4,6-dideoxy-N-acetyl-beta-L-altrosamine transaminase [Opitutaceae bacterium]